MEYSKVFLVFGHKRITNERFVGSVLEAVAAIERAKQADAEAKIKVLEEQIGSLK